MLNRLARTRTQSTLHAAGGAAMGITALALVAFAWPALDRRSERLTLRTAVEAADQRLQQTREQLSAARREVGELAARLNASPATSATISLDRRLLDVSSVAGELNVFLDSVEPGAVVRRAGGATVTTVAATGRGAYPRVAAFIHQLRERAPDMTVETMQLTSSADGSCAFRLSMSWWTPPVGTSRPLVASNGGDGR